MQHETEYDDTQIVLQKLFPNQFENTGSTYISNDYFIKNKHKYNIPNENLAAHNLKLPYLDSFLTRYTYYTFTRWLHRVKLFLGVTPEWYL